ncbi:MAG: glycerophosphodiester phosphodiesterase [Bifidobacteriaceae bacterium]|nr:glycerophosphodiester phosphodiesterase [Bifidobacteriaceae bacterium]
MNSLRYVGASIREFASRWGSYLMLIAIVAGAVDFVVIPILRRLTELLFSVGHLAYLGYDNVGFALTRRPLVVLGLLAIMLAILVLVYLQFAVLLEGTENIRLRKGLRARAVVGSAFRKLRHFRFRSFGFFAAYFILVVPFTDLIVGSSLLSKVTIPDFILDFLTANPVFMVFLVVLYVGATYLGVRLIRVLPNAILRGMSFGDAVRDSWGDTKRHFWFYLWRIVWLFIIASVTTWAWSSALIELQAALDDRGWVSFPAAIVTMTLLIVGKIFLSGATTVLYLLFLTAPRDVTEGREETVPPETSATATVASPSPKKADTERLEPTRVRRNVRRRAIIIIAVILTVVTAIFNGLYMYGLLDDRPLTISHRGVDNGNGVQNTIPSLTATAKKHPDYVETDVHETKDEKFVVMHDENVKALTGTNARPRDLTLAQLQKLTAHENGRSARVASLDSYLSAAKRLKQKLIVEVKTTKRDSPDMIERFIDGYSKELIAQGDRVHSLDYRVVSQVHKRAPKLYVSFIMPYSLVFPNTHANAYTLEETTLNESFVDRAHDRGQAVWAWTINDTDQMEQMMFLGVDGIVTDNLSGLQETIRSEESNPSYAQRLRVFSNVMDSFGGADTIEN